MSNQFSDEQKQYLSGFTFGADVARAVSGLPIVSGGGAAAGTSVTVGGSATQKSLPVGPERIALIAQDATVAAGKKLCKEEVGKQQKNPLDMWDEIAERCDANEFPKGINVFLTKWQGLFYTAPAQNSYMCRMRIPGGILQAWQFRGIADLADKRGAVLSMLPHGQICKFARSPRTARWMSCTD